MGPAAFTPGHAGLMQMISVLLAERMPEDGTVLVIGAGAGLETSYLGSGLIP
jgi:tRNA (cmo5U34)-methyltransferase